MLRPIALPEYFLGDPGTQHSDLFSLGVVTYEMLTGRFPYGAEVSKARSRKAQRRLRYGSAQNGSRRIPDWIDDTLRRAVHPDPLKRQEAISEFTADLRRPNPDSSSATAKFSLLIHVTCRHPPVRTSPRSASGRTSRCDIS